MRQEAAQCTVGQHNGITTQKFFTSLFLIDRKHFINFTKSVFWPTVQYIAYASLPMCVCVLDSSSRIALP